MTGHPDLYQCRQCGERFKAWAPAERHSRQTGHNRIEALDTPTLT